MRSRRKSGTRSGSQRRFSKMQVQQAGKSLSRSCLKVYLIERKTTGIHVKLKMDG